MKIVKNHLTEDQQKKAVSLFLVGVSHYTDISRELKVPYQAVNTYMTKWKKRNGVLQKRKRKAKQLDIPVPMPKDTMEELEFLRKYYLLNTMKNKEIKKEAA
tara:strand:+ start:103 stop:408 length:306 start_codon:yes stop_codon:yes gene_type:complete